MNGIYHTNGDYYTEDDEIAVGTLVGKTFKRVFVEDDDYDIVMLFQNDEETYVFLHDQNCCERVRVNDITGTLSDLENTPILMAEDVTNKTELPPDPEDTESFTWTFYRFATSKGFVVVRWLGESNGCYSEKVSFVKLDSKND